MAAGKPASPEGWFQWTFAFRNKPFQETVDTNEEHFRLLHALLERGDPQVHAGEALRDFPGQPFLLLGHFGKLKLITPQGAQGFGVITDKTVEEALDVALVRIGQEQFRFLPGRRASQKPHGLAIRGFWRQGDLESVMPVTDPIGPEIGPELRRLAVGYGLPFMNDIYRYLVGVIFAIGGPPEYRSILDFIDPA